MEDLKKNSLLVIFPPQGQLFRMSSLKPTHDASLNLQLVMKEKKDYQSERNPFIISPMWTSGITQDVEKQNKTKEERTGTVKAKVAMEKEERSQG